MRRVVTGSRLTRGFVLFTSGLFLALVVEQAPHLVHHLFEPAQGETECAFATGAERSQAVVPELVALVVPLAVEVAGPLVDPSTLPTLARIPAPARAPPPAVS